MFYFISSRLLSLVSVSYLKIKWCLLVMTEAGGIQHDSISSSSAKRQIVLEWFIGNMVFLIEAWHLSWEEKWFMWCDHECRWLKWLLPVGICDSTSGPWKLVLTRLSKIKVSFRASSQLLNFFFFKQTRPEVQRRETICHTRN